VSLEVYTGYVTDVNKSHLALGLLKSSDVSREEMSKMLADIFKDALDDCFATLNAWTLPEIRKTAAKRKISIMMAADRNFV
jgi:hypothetical protein